MSLILDPSEEAAANGSPHGPQFLASYERRLRPSHAAVRGEFWRRGAAKALRRGGIDADAAWALYWRKRFAPPSVVRLVHATGTPLAWGCNPDALTEESRALVELADDLARGAKRGKFAKGNGRARLDEALGNWLDVARDGNTDFDLALGCLAATHVLYELGGKIDAGQAWEAIDLLFEMAEDACHWQAAEDPHGRTALAEQLLAGELPLTLAYYFSEMTPLAALRRPARERLAVGIEQIVGDAGHVRAAYHGVMRPLAACWTRARAIGRRTNNGEWSKKTHKHFRSFVRQCLRWTGADGRQMLGDAGEPRWPSDALAATLRVGGGTGDAAAARQLLTDAKLAKPRPRAKAKTPPPSSHSEWAQATVLRSAWSPQATSVAIDFSRGAMRMEVAANGRRVFDGVWAASPRVAGKPLEPTGPWNEVCWFTDDDVDYLEFRLDLTGGARLERQVLLARRDRFLLLADHLQNSSAAALDLAWELPLVTPLKYRGEEETRDAALIDDRPVARLIPPALPEWRIESRVGELVDRDGVVRLEEHGAGRALACPLFIDLHPRRVSKPCTWRQLTVAEALVIQPADVAVGYRVQCGRDQWLIYRSQGPRGNRTLLGQNTSSEFLAARFLVPSGTIEELVEVQG